MAKKSNIELRNRVKAGGFRLWELAAEVGVSYNTFLTWLRFELTGEKLERVTEALEELEKK